MLRWLLEDDDTNDNNDELSLALYCDDVDWAVVPIIISLLWIIAVGFVGDENVIPKCCARVTSLS